MARNMPMNICKKIFKHLILIPSSFVAISCDSSDPVQIEKVDSAVLLSDDELTRHNKDKTQNINTKVFFFGFDLRSSPQEDAAQYLPFLNYLNEKTGYVFKLHFTPQSETIIDEIGQNKVQFAAMGATSFIEANIRYGVIPLVRGLNLKGKAEYRSFFVSKYNSSINNLNNTDGLRLSFGNKNSTQGHLIPRIILYKNMIDLNSFKTYQYTGSHQNCAESVVSNEADICGMQDQLAIELAQRRLVKIIHRSRYYPSSGIVANKNVPENVIVKVTSALLDFKPTGKHKDGLYNWHKTEMPRGFIKTRQNDYAELRKWLLKFDFITNQNKKK